VVRRLLVEQVTHLHAERARDEGEVGELRLPLAVLHYLPYPSGMGYALAKEQQRYVSSLVKSGRFNNQSEAVREAIRRMQAQETEYLTPPPLTPAQVEAIYGTADRQEKTVGLAAFRAVRAAARKGAKP